MKLVLLGAPGAGKGTQAEILSRKLNIPTISTGNILREAMKYGTPVGLKAKSHVESGKLVPEMCIRDSDKVVVLSGKNKGKEGKVLSADPKGGKVIVEGVNVATKHRMWNISDVGERE